MKAISIFSFVVIILGAILLVASSISALHVGPVAPATVEASSSFFNKLSASVIPVINEYARNLVIPGKDEEHFQYNSFKLASFNLGPIDFEFIQPDQVKAKLTSLELAIDQTEFKLKDKILFISVSCKGHFSVSTSGDSAEFSMKLIDQDGKLHIQGSTDVTVKYGAFDVKIKMDDFLCKIGEDIINLFTGGIDNVVRKLIEKDLAPMIQKSITKALDDAFQKMPLQITGPPSVKASNPPVLVLPIDLDSLVKQQQQKRSSSSSAIAHPPHLLSSVINRAAFLRRFSLGPNDIAVVLPQTSINTVIQTIKSIGKLGPIVHIDKKLTTDIFELLLPEACIVCPHCPLRFDVDFVLAPTVDFTPNNATVNIQNLSLAIAGVNGTDDANVAPLFTLGLMTALSVDNFTISGTVDNIVHFDFGVETLTFTQIASQVGPLPIAVLNLVAGIIQNVLIPSFNREWPGIDFFQNSTLDINRIDIDVQSEVFRAGLDVTLKQ